MKFGIFYEHQLPRGWDEYSEHKLLNDSLREIELADQLGFDYAFNYKDGTILNHLKEGAPKGIDVYFDNVGGDISDAVLVKINQFARIVVCGAISVYNATSLPQSLSVQPFLVRNSALMQGLADGYFVLPATLGNYLAEAGTDRPAPAPGSASDGPGRARAVRRQAAHGQHVFLAAREIPRADAGCRLVRHLTEDRERRATRTPQACRRRGRRGQ